MNRIEEEARIRLLARRSALARNLEAVEATELRQLEGTAQRQTDRDPPPDLDAQARITRAELFELSEIDAALSRIELGTYGHCEVCDGAIGRQRLLALPHARRCIDCTQPASARRTG